MLILGMSTSTKQVGTAIGGHEGVLASTHSARGKRHAENLVPAIDFVRRQRIQWKRQWLRYLRRDRGPEGSSAENLPARTHSLDGRPRTFDPYACCAGSESN